MTVPVRFRTVGRGRAGGSLASALARVGWDHVGFLGRGDDLSGAAEGVDLLVIATDADAVYLDWGTPDQKAIAQASPDAIEAYDFPAGSMGPKVEAAADFARLNPGSAAVIGALEDLPEIMAGTKGTRITTDATEVTFR